MFYYPIITTPFITLSEAHTIKGYYVRSLAHNGTEFQSAFHYQDIQPGLFLAFALGKLTPENHLA